MAGINFIEEQEYLPKLKFKMGRTKGEWKKSDVNEKSIVDDADDRFNGLILQTNGKNREEALANRDFILLAVNNHDKLVEALRPFAALAKHFDGTFGMRPTEGEIQVWEDRNGTDGLTVEMLKEAEQLLQTIKATK
jgi:hypothetical protein